MHSAGRDGEPRLALVRMNKLEPGDRSPGHHPGRRQDPQERLDMAFSGHLIGLARVFDVTGWLGRVLVRSTLSRGNPSSAGMMVG